MLWLCRCSTIFYRCYLISNTSGRRNTFFFAMLTLSIWQENSVSPCIVMEWFSSSKKNGAFCYALTSPNDTIACSWIQTLVSFQASLLKPKIKLHDTFTERFWSLKFYLFFMPLLGAQQACSTFWSWSSCLCIQPQNRTSCPQVRWKVHQGPSLFLEGLSLWMMKTW